MPFQIGNTEQLKGSKPKPYAEALRLEIKAAGEAENPHKALRRVARAHLKRAEAGDIAAIKELADRLDGKVPQAVVGDDESPPAFQAWLAWMQVLAIGDTKSISHPSNDINGLATYSDDAAGRLAQQLDAKLGKPGCSPPSDPAGGGNLVPSSEEETLAP